MKNALPATALAWAVATTALAQGPTTSRPAMPPVPSRSLPADSSPQRAPGQPKTDPSLARTSANPADLQAPQPMPASAIANTTVDAPPQGLPVEPLEPFLLTVNQGPFMINAYSFRGPWAARHAQALSMELRRMGWPAYVFPSRIQPGGSNIRNVPPTAPDHIKTGELTPPESYRSYDEAAVLVGNYLTLDDAAKDLRRVKGLKPQHIDGPNSIWTAADPRAHRMGLTRAYVTQNPLVPAQRLYPNAKDIVIKPGGTIDPFVMGASIAAPRVDSLVKRLNQGPRSLLNCPGTFTLVVAEYGGRSTFNAADPRFRDDRYLKDSPLQTAHDDAEALADALGKCEVVKKSGHKVYVYHDRASSKVCVGAFQDKEDPAAAPVRDLIMKQVNLFKSKDGSLAPAKLELDSGASAPAGRITLEDMLKFRVKKDSIQRYAQDKGEFVNLTPWTTLMPVPKG